MSSLNWKKGTAYNTEWPEGTSALDVEMFAIAHDGYWRNQRGEKCGFGLIHHYMSARKLIWPSRYWHRWTELCYTEFIKNDLTVLMGAASTQKTSTSVEYCLLNWWARPDKTLVILSTTNMEKMDIGIWAELKSLWERGQKRWPSLPGYLLDYKRSITFEDLRETGRSRDFRQGMICRPCYKGGKFVGLGTIAGVKQEYIYYVADELQFMAPTFTGSWPHLFSNGKVKIIGSGNPKHDPDDELGKTAEPQCGWSNLPEPEETAVWDTKFMGGRCIDMVGTDSPNFDTDENEPDLYKGLIGRAFERRMAHDHGVASFEYYRLVKGVMRVQFAYSRVITRQLCREHGAFDAAEWSGAPRKMVYGLDPTYGGDDRCVGTPLEFGVSIDGTQILKVYPYRVFRFDLTSMISVEDQLAEMLEEELEKYGMRPEDCFYDSTGKGTLGGAFARRFGYSVPVPVDSGQKPTSRPVRFDLFVNAPDGLKRLKRCDEHYSKFVTEMWFSAREAIESGQTRELPEDVMLEGCARIYRVVKGNRLEVESKSDPRTKEDLKRRLGKSPDLFDSYVIGIEGARQRGFRIARLGVDPEGAPDEDGWWENEEEEFEDSIKDKLLQHV